ncbi:heavy-metal-associated domain-containing protein [Altererythrobacter sp. ZODW24]|uniref:heavy-metal-associated domain-containing protein n=1 Tax=Altererythrobacter sp. ZODW24 TaxID=2185142 RepID=UPI000DF7C63A|nr:heavy-metal-associated domain-containing protein [Altererythrobacter sp. ZODW24]
MTFAKVSSTPLMRRFIPALIAACVLAIAGVLAWQSLTAQVAGERGIAPLTSSTDIEVGDLKVDVIGKNSDDARKKGWRAAQRLGWKKLGGPSIGDSQLESMVSAVVIESEQIGPRRYIATLGVIFDRSRAGRSLGASGRRTRSAPMLLLPVLESGGVNTMFEMRNPWQRVWAEYQSGASAINYVRPSGANGDSLLLTFGQTGRRSRTWWRNILDQFEAADVLVPVAKLQRQWPGGPIEGEFTARYGPDNRYLDSFKLTADNEEGLTAMLVQARGRFNDIYAKALSDGLLKPDATLNFGGGSADPAIQRLIALGRQILANERAAAAAERAAATREAEPTPTPTPTATAAVVASYVVQFATPDAPSVDAALSGVRGTAGVRGVATSSIAIGGTSVMRVSYAGTLPELAAALRSRGFAVNEGTTGLGISR